jgi:hypothetical protein
MKARLFTNVEAEGKGGSEAANRGRARDGAGGGTVLRESRLDRAQVGSAPFGMGPTPPRSNGA